jgi:cytoskeletal protein CcmA (bactofilin family)
MFEKNQTSTPRSSRETTDKNIPTTVITAATKIVGSITTTEHLRIEGRIEGDIDCENLTVGETGEVVGDIAASSIMMHGTIKGQVKTDMLRLTSTSRIDGGVILKNWIVDSGAKVDATCHFTDKPSEFRGKDEEETSKEELKVIEGSTEKKAKAS